MCILSVTSSVICFQSFILYRYPDHAVQILDHVCQYLPTIEDPEAKVNIIHKTTNYKLSLTTNNEEVHSHILIFIQLLITKIGSAHLDLGLLRKTLRRRTLPPRITCRALRRRTASDKACNPHLLHAPPLLAPRRDAAHPWVGV